MNPFRTVELRAYRKEMRAECRKYSQKVHSSETHSVQSEWRQKQIYKKRLYLTHSWKEKAALGCLCLFYCREGTTHMDSLVRQWGPLEDTGLCVWREHVCVIESWLRECNRAARRNQANCHQSAGGKFGRTVTAARLMSVSPPPSPCCSPSTNSLDDQCVSVCTCGRAPLCVFSGLSVTSV